MHFHTWVDITGSENLVLFFPFLRSQKGFGLMSFFIWCSMKLCFRFVDQECPLLKCPMEYIILGAKLSHPMHFRPWHSLCLHPTILFSGFSWPAGHLRGQVTRERLLTQITVLGPCHQRLWNQLNKDEIPGMRKSPLIIVFTKLHFEFSVDIFCGSSC